MNDTDLQALIKTTIQTQVVHALNSVPEALEKLVQAALKKPVDSDGGTRGYGNKIPYLDYIVGEEIRSAARSAVRTVIQERTADIEAKVREGLGSDSVVAAMTKALVKAAESDWRINVKFETEKDD